MQKVFSLNELIATSENKLTIHTVKDYCRRGELHPCIYFEGNIICIHEERFQDSIDKRDPVAHIETVSWARKFKGYISASNFINYIDNHDPHATDVFYNVEKIIEYISPIDPVPMLKPDEYLKAFPPKIDDDIQEKKWLREAYDFTGNVFRASEIVFHCNEVNQLLNLEKSKTQLKFLDYSDNKVLSKVAKSLYFSPLTAACLMTGDDPEQLEILKTANQKLYESKYPENVEALALILRAIEMGILKADSNLFINEIPLKEFLVERGYIITGFNKSHYDGTYFPYHYDKKRFKQPIPLNLSEFDPLSEINYLKFKVESQYSEIKNLRSIIKDLPQEQEKISELQIPPQSFEEYSTPALEALKGVIQEFWIDYDPILNVPTKQSTTMEWIANNYPELADNDYIQKAIDKICRHPKAKLGGNSKNELKKVIKNIKPITPKK